MKMDDANPNIHKPSPTKPSPANTRHINDMARSVFWWGASRPREACLRTWG